MGPSCRTNRSTLVEAMMTDVKRDTILVYQTMYSLNNKSSPWIPEFSDVSMSEHDEVVLFLKRLMLCFATCGLTFTSEENGDSKKVWPFPLASALCHGGR